MSHQLPMEVERKFLVARPPPGWRRSPCNRITQGYLAVELAGAEVRLRRLGCRHLLSFKGPGVLRRVEREIPITDRQFRILWPATATRRVYKRRYYIRYNHRTIELDVYGGQLRGLITAEVAFPSIAASRRFVKPVWFSREVTGDLRFRNQTLARHGQPELRPKGTPPVPATRIE